ncbi:monocarboxylate transporter 12-like isoform X2 [Ptychodera flava]|uniref:monocarboxylate transporter 12-like isoform X2 n=1 Tax=Ptychodera flava TaxID=63121 RepID=UPI00396A2E2B
MVQEKVTKAHKRRSFGDPPDGGWGWMVVAAGFLLLFLVRGIQNSVGVFFVVLLDHFGEGAGTTSILATCLTSMSLISGIGFGLSRVPTVAMIGRYFKKRHAIANGMTVVGTGCGSFAVAPLTRVLIDQYGWRGSFIVIGALAFNICVCGALLRPIYLKGDAGDHADTVQYQKDEKVSISGDEDVNSEPPKKLSISCSDCSSYFDLKLLKHPMFATIVVAYLFFGFGLNIPLIHVVKRAVDVGVSQGQAPFLLSTLGLCMMIGGVAQGFAVDLLHLSKCRALGFDLVMYGLGTLFLPVTQNFIGMCVIMAWLGLSRGGFAGISAVVVRFVAGHARFTSAYGMSTAAAGTAQLIGPVVAGYLYDYTEDYAVSFYMAGTSSLIGGILILVGHLFWERSRKKQQRQMLEDEREVSRGDEAEPDVTHGGSALPVDQTVEPMILSAATASCIQSESERGSAISLEMETIF